MDVLLDQISPVAPTHGIEQNVLPFWLAEDVEIEHLARKIQRNVLQIFSAIFFYRLCDLFRKTQAASKVRIDHFGFLAL